MELTLGQVTDQDESNMFFHVAKDHVIVAYLAHDEDCRNPMEDSDGNGMVYTSSRHAMKEQHEGFQKAIGFNSDFQPDHELADPQKILKLLAEDVRLSHDGKNEGRLFKTVYDSACTNSERNETETTQEFVLRYIEHSKPNDLAQDFDMDPYYLAAWVEGRLDGTIGDKYAVSLDVYEHSGISYSISGQGQQCAFDTARSGAVWVPDESAIENFEDKALSLEENRQKARDYAKGCVEEYTEWCNGENYGHIIERHDIEGRGHEELAACWGFIGYDYAKTECKEQFEFYVNQEPKMKVKVNTGFELSAESISDIFDCAFEGGINYWCSRAETTYVDGFIVSAILTDAEDDDKQDTVTAEGVVEALEKIIDGTYECNAATRTSITRAVIECDMCYIDADGADTIVQFAVFKELVYG